MLLVSPYGRTKIHPDKRKPFVGRTQYTRTWYWECERCNRKEILSGHTHTEVLTAALVHAGSWPHYYARYSAKPA
jgi:hypothetical protein